MNNNEKRTEELLQLVKDKDNQENEYDWNYNQNKFFKEEGPNKSIEEWMKNIQGVDGNLKKIVFYNIGVTTILKYEEKVLEKMEEVFLKFKKNANELILLWRPHPLMEATIKSMRPELWKKYEIILNNYKIEKWGIYDDTADLNRSIVLSDIYYGDRSSIATLFNIAGKNVVFQNFEKNNIDMNSYMTCCDDFAINENCLYLSAKKYDGLCEIDIENLKVEYISSFTQSKGYTMYMNQCMHSAIFYDAEKLICIPRYSKYILICNLKNNEIEKIEINFEKKINESRFSSAIKIKNNIYCFSEIYDGIVIFNIEKKEAEVLGYDYIKKEEGYYFVSWPVMKNDKIYIPYYSKNTIFIFDINRKNIEYIKMENKGEGYISCDIIGNYLCMMSKNKKLIFYDLEKNISRYHLNYEGEVFSWGKKIWIVDSFKKKITIIEFTNKIEKIYEKSILEQKFWNNCNILKCKKIDGSLYIIATNGLEIGVFTFDLETKDEKLYRIRLESFEKIFYKMKYYINENDIPINLIDLFENSFLGKIDDKSECYGEKIWTKMKCL